MKELPVRPRPLDLEPLLGYMHRLARANGYGRAKELWCAIAEDTEQHEKILLTALRLKKLPMFGAPAPRWLTLAVDHRGLPPVHFNLYELRYCPGCLSERPDIRPFWSLNFAVVCARHKCWLRPFALSSNTVTKQGETDGEVSKIVLALSRLLEKSLEKKKAVRDVVLTSIDRPLSTPKIIKLIRALIFISNDQFTDQGIKCNKSYVFENAKAQLICAASMLEDWPSSFWKTLDRMMNVEPTSMSVKQVFGRLYEVLYKEIKEPEYHFIRQGFEAYLADFWRGEISGRHRRFNRDLIASQHRISIAMAERKLGISDRTLKSMINSGALSKTKTQRVGKREFTTVDFDELQRSMEKTSKLLDLCSASDLVGINRRRLRELITAGHLLATASPLESSDNRWKIEEVAIDELAVKFMAKRKSIKDQVPLVLLTHALRFWRFDAAEWCALFQAMLDGGVSFRCIGAFSFSRIELEKSELRSWLKERSSKHRMPIQIRDAAIYLEIKEEVMYQLVANGFIPTRMAVKRGHCYQGIDVRDIHSFQERYVSLADLAKNRGTSPRHLKRLLTATPVTGPSIDGCRQYFYLRKSLENKH